MIRIPVFSKPLMNLQLGLDSRP